MLARSPLCVTLGCTPALNRPATHPQPRWNDGAARRGPQPTPEAKESSISARNTPDSRSFHKSNVARTVETGHPRGSARRTVSVRWTVRSNGEWRTHISGCIVSATRNHANFTGLLGRYLFVRHITPSSAGRPDRESIVLHPTRTSLDRRRSNCQVGGSLRCLIRHEYLTNNQR